MGIESPVDQARIRHQIELERLYNKNQTVSRIKKEFHDCTVFDFKQHMIDNKIDIEFGFDLLAQMAIHKRATVPVLVGILMHHYDDQPNCLQRTADALLNAAKADLVDWVDAIQQFVVKIDIGEDVQRELDMFQYPLPMVVPPIQLKSNRDTGYMCSRSSVILRDNHHENDVVLDHINRANSIKFCINFDTANMIKNTWRNLDKPKDGESKADYQKRVKAFNKYDRSARDVMNILLKEGNEFYLTHRYDKRGRIYCQGYHVNYQGASWNKAVIELYDKELVT